MNRRETLTEMGRRKISAILRTDDTEVARKAMEAAVAGGFRMVEFTLTIPGALELITEFSRRDELLVGAGTVLDSRQAKAAVKAGASFVVSPVVDPEVIKTARSLDVVSIPGTATPTEMVAARAAGADVIKIFPAPADLRAFVVQVLGPLPELKLFPTAGVTPDNFRELFEVGVFGVGFVTSLFDPADMVSGNFEAIQTRALGIMDGSGQG